MSANDPNWTFVSCELTFAWANLQPALPQIAAATMPDSLATKSPRRSSQGRLGMVKWLPTWFKLRNIIVLALACVVFATGSPGQTWLVRQSDEGVSTPARGTKSELGNAVLAQAEPTSMGSSNTPFEADAAQRANVSAVESAQRAAEAQEAELQAMEENYKRTIAFIKAIKEFIQSAFGQAFARRPHVLLAAQPTKRFVTVAEIVGLVRFLCGDDAKSITGAMLPIDGGWTAE